MRWFRRSLVRKMTAIYFAAVLLPLLAVLLLSYFLYEREMNKQVAELYHQIVNQSASKLDGYLKQVSALSTIPYENKEMLDFLSGDDAASRNYPDQYWPSKQWDIMNQVSSSYLGATKGMIGFFLYGSEGKVFYQSRYALTQFEYRFELAPWYDRALAAQEKNIILGTHRESQIQGQPYVISIVRLLLNFADRRPIGAIKIDMDASVLADTLGPIERYRGNRVFVTDERGLVAYDSSGGDTLQQPFDALSFGGDCQVFRSEPTDVSWRVINVVPNGAIDAPLTTLRVAIEALIAVCLSFVIVLLIIVSNYVVRPIRQLRRLMHEVEMENFTAAFTGRQTDEIGALGRGFNRMSGRIGELIENVYRAEIASKEAQLAALKSEINPHFLFNALESVRMRAQLGDTEATTRTILALAQMLRASLGEGEPVIPLREEWRRLTDYLTIVNIHSGDRLQISCEIEEAHLDVPVLRFILQPILENAVKHGVEASAGITNVWVRSELRDDGLYIRIENDGPPIPYDRLHRIRRTLELNAKAATDSGIGLANVHRRIRLYYGAPYGVSIGERQPHGVAIELRLPADGRKLK